MSIYCILKDFASPIATVIAATVAGVFALLQWRTARFQADLAVDKIKHETFKERIAVFDAAQDLIMTSLNRSLSHSEQISKLLQYKVIMRTSVFYYGPEVVSLMEEIINKSAELISFTEAARRNDSVNWQEYNLKASDRAIELANIAENLSENFKKYLSFNKLKNATL